MSVTNESNKRYTERFASPQFTERDFVGVLLPLLCQNGINRINEDELQEKLYCYFKNDEFEELFQKINSVKGINEMKVNLSDGLFREKYLGGYIWFDQFYSHILNLTYDKDYDFAYYEQGLSEQGKLKIRQIAQELAIRYRAESKSGKKLLIYGFNPNVSYSLVYGKNIGRIMGFDLITDGEIESVDYPDRVGKEYLYYESPLNSNEGIQLKFPKVAEVKIKNATYTIKQAICDGNIRFCKVNTQVLEEEKLNEIVELTNQSYEKDQYSLTDEAPYVRELTLK